MLMEFVMKIILKSSLVASFLILAQSSMAGTFIDSASVISVDKVYKQVRVEEPYKECYIKESVQSGDGSATNEIIGGIIGGAIISGAYFGDKMSPLSDTTNLAPAMAGTDLFTHIKYMMYTTIPSFIITLILFLVLGFQSDVSSAQNIDELLLVLSTSFNITPWLFLVPIMVILLIIKKVPAIPSLLIGTLLGGFFAVIFQLRKSG